MMNCELNDKHGINRAYISIRICYLHPLFYLFLYERGFSIIGFRERGKITRLLGVCYL
ncbi:hypothetical protein HanIR_Chr10g0484381 [Helianthus annuus]|nr:hypothetical protein HanIR_Chr10g0484381 [Helianthus annuus]